eukprot:263685-Alexandrium_andersonii.AAC.1
MFSAPSVVSPPLTPEQLGDAIKCGARTAPGFDSWSPLELSWLSRGATQALCRLLNAVEHGVPWPTQLLWCRSCFVSKSGDRVQCSFDRLNWRILSVLPALYRKWATLRVRELRDW